jgi:Na+/melibiose symporter-like transporter
VLPGACYILAILPVYFTAITKPVHSRIMRQIHRRQDGCDSVNDPVTGETILCKLDKEAEKRKNVFTPR